MMKKLKRRHFVLALAVSLFIAGAFFPDRLLLASTALRQPLACENVVELGSIPVAEETSRTIPFYNLSFRAVEVRSVSTSCGCTIASNYSKTIGALRKGVFTISVTPGHPGKGEQSVEIQSSKGDQLVLVRYQAS